MSLTANVNVNIVISILQVSKSGLRQIPWQSHSPWIGRNVLKADLWGSCCNPTMSQGPSHWVLLLTFHFFQGVSWTLPGEHRPFAMHHYYSSIFLCGLQNHLTSCCLGLPVCEMGIKLHCCTSVYPVKLPGLMINEIMEGACCTSGRLIYYRAGSMFFLPFTPDKYFF